MGGDACDCPASQRLNWERDPQVPQDSRQMALAFPGTRTKCTAATPARPHPGLGHRALDMQRRKQPLPQRLCIDEELPRVTEGLNPALPGPTQGLQPLSRRPCPKLTREQGGWASAMQTDSRSPLRIHLSALPRRQGAPEANRGAQHCITVTDRTAWS